MAFDVDTGTVRHVTCLLHNDGTEQITLRFGPNPLQLHPATQISQPGTQHVIGCRMQTYGF